MIGFIILLAVAIVGFVVYLALRGGAKVADAHLDDRDDGPAVPETLAAAEHHARIVEEQERHKP